MRLRLANGVVAAPGTAAWIPVPRHGAVRLEDEDEAAPGAAIALGPAEADGEDVRKAVAELERLVRDGGSVAAGAGVDLGGGFRSARLDGARGDQRDAVLAALKVLGVAGSGRLGDRAGFLVALFGPAVTKRVGAAAARAIEEGRWSALHLAAAASDVLGPEQLERVLALEAPGGADLIAGGRPSVLAADLRRVLEPVPGPRRLELLLDLWDRVSAHHARLARRARLLSTQGRQDRLDDLRKRRAHFEDEVLLKTLRRALGKHEPSLAEAARWQPEGHYWFGVLLRVLEDALSATALLRTAVAVADHGTREGLARSEPILRATANMVARSDREWPGWKEPKSPGLPARPGAYVCQIVQKLDAPRKPEDEDKFAAYFRQRLARARDYGRLSVETIGAVLRGDLNVPEGQLHSWADEPLGEWREQVDRSPARPLADWNEVPGYGQAILGRRELPATRLADPEKGGEEEVGDLLWFADLADALAALYGHDAAKVRPELEAPWLDTDPVPDEADPLAPRYDSVARAVSGAAQLAALGGGNAPRRGARTWEAFAADLLADAEISEALGGEFAVPPALTALDGTVVPGTGGARIRLARSARMLAEWSNYMGNCIAGPAYVHDALAGRCGLVALHGEDGRILVNMELSPLWMRARGWHITEIAARFNEDPDPDLERVLRGWVAKIPASVPDPPLPEEAEPVRPVRRSPRPRLLQDAGPALAGPAERAWTDEFTSRAARVLAALSNDDAPFATLTRLRRLGSGPLANTCRNALASGADLADLWELTGIRPMDTALRALDPALRDRFGQLELLTGPGPLPASLRKLARDPRVAPAYSMGLVGLRMRAAIGRLVLDGDPAVLRSATRRTTVPMLCALTVHVTCGAPAIDLAPVTPPKTTTVPGFPPSTLDDEDGPWQQALPDARELGADTGVFWDRVAEHGLRVPATWLNAGGWQSLWSRAHA
ncbi:hypothetical protein [Actinomadura vinacea]